MKTRLQKMMRRLMSFVMGLAILSAAQVNVDNAIDFTLTDVHGMTHHLFDYLDNGKYVVINLTLMG